jgi:hypothetical protein
MDGVASLPLASLRYDTAYSTPINMHADTNTHADTKLGPISQTPQTWPSEPSNPPSIPTRRLTRVPARMLTSAAPALPFNPLQPQRPFTPTKRPEASPHPASSTNDQHRQLRESARSKLNQAHVSLQTAAAHFTASITNFQSNHYLLGMHYAVSSAGSVMAAGSNMLGGLADLAKAQDQRDIGKRVQDAANYIQPGGGPVAALARSLRDMDTALTTLADPTKNFYEKQRDLAYAIGSILYTAGASGHAWHALTGKPNELVARLNATLSNSGDILRGLQNLQRNAQGLSDAVEQSNTRNIASYGSGVIYSVGEMTSGLGRTMAQALKDSGYSEASEALMTLSTRAQNVGFLASNTQIMINSLWPA